MKEQQEKLEKLKKMFQDGLKEIEALKNEKPKFEVGKYYKNCVGTVVYNDGKYGLSFEKKGMTAYSNDDNFFDNIHTSGTTLKWHEAPSKEVEQHLIEEAKKRGFVKGVKFDKPKEWGYVTPEVFNKDSFIYNLEEDVLGNGFSIIYKAGKWAEIIEDKILIGGYEVEIVDNGRSVGTGLIAYTTIDGHIFTKEFWQAAKLISEHSKAKIMVGCSKQFDVSLEQINQILDKLK